MCSLCIASLGGPPIGGQDRDGASYRCSAPYTLSRFAGLPLKGKREVWRGKIESHIFHVPFRSFPPLVVNAVSQSPECVSCHMTQKGKSRNVLASPLGEEGHEVAKGWTVVRSKNDTGRRLAVRTAMEHPIGALPRTPFPASRDFPSRGNEKYGEEK